MGYDELLLLLRAYVPQLPMKLPVCLLAFMLPFGAFAQLGSTVQNPSSVKWSQIKTPHFRVIFPRGQDSVGTRLAHTLETVYEPVSKTLGKKPRPISLVLQNQTTVSNGFVTLLPRHSEFYITSPQDANFVGLNRWLDLLSVHEFRHVVQNDKALTGFSKILYYGFGYNALSFINIGIPDWFTEGDAVCTETALTPGGRGRIPEFNLLFRTQLTSRKTPFSYSKAVAGSYRDNIPDWYVLGYHLANYARRTYGPDIWDKTLQRYYSFPLYPFSFSNSLRKSTGHKIEQLYTDALADFRREWTTEDAQYTPVQDVPASPAKVYTDYVTPQYLADGRLVALRSGLADIPAFVTLDGKTERQVHQTGFVNNSATLSTGGKIIVWAEQHFDPRWGMRDYTVIKSMDVDFRNLNQLTFKSRYFAPTLSPDASRLVVVETETSGNSRLVLLNGYDGSLRRVFNNPDGAFLQQPRFLEDGKHVVFIAQQAARKYLRVLDTDSGSQETLFETGNENIAQPVVSGKWVFYNSPLSGIDNIYAFDTETKIHYQVTNRPFGAYHVTVSPDGKTLAFQDFRSEGFRIATIPFEPGTWKKKEEVRPAATRAFGPLVQQENQGNILKQVPSGPLAVKPYSKANLFNIYGWGPVFESTGTGLTLGLQSQNLLSTTFASAGYGYDAGERRGRWFGNFSYLGWFPVIDVGVVSAERSTTLPIDRAQPIDSMRTDRWRQNELNIGLRLPLILTHSKYREGLNLSVQANFIQTKGYDLPRRYLDEPGTNNLAATTLAFAYSRLLRQAKRDVQPRLGQVLSLYARNTPFGGVLSGNLFAAQARLFFPGLAKHHSLRLFGGMQFQGSGDSYSFGSPMFFPRGYSYVSTDQLYTGTIQYQLPLAYPDWNLGRLLYIQRIKLNAFGDFGQGISGENDRSRFVQQYRSAGLDLSFEFNVLRLRQPFEAGLRAVWTEQKGMLIQPLVVDIGF